MPAFAFHALAPGGTTTRGAIDAETERHARQLLRARGLYPTRIDLQRAGPRSRRSVGRDHGALALTTRELATLLSAGVPLSDALDAVAESEHGTGWDAIWTEVGAGVRAGTSLADALTLLAPVFPPTYEALVRAGEASGTLPATLARLATSLDHAAATRAQLRSALTYPAIMLAVTALMLGFLLAWVVPQLTQLVRDTRATLPFATEVLLAIVTVMRAAGWWIAGAIGLAVLGVTAWARTAAGRRTLDATVLRVPVVGPLVRAAAAGRIARTLGGLLASAVPIDTALPLAAAGAGNETLRLAVEAARRDVERGRPLAAALATTNVFPPLIARLAATGERGGTLATALERAADALDADVARRVRALTALVEPTLVLIMGAVVLSLVLAILVPLMSLSGGNG